MSQGGQTDPFAWLLGVMTTITLGWAGHTSLKTGQHGVKIAVLETEFKNVKESLERIEDHLGTKPRAES